MCYDIGEMVTRGAMVASLETLKRSTRSEPGPVFTAADEPRVTLAVTVDREDGWLFEHARLLGKHAGTP